MKIQLSFLLILAMAVVNAQDFETTLKFFTEKSMPYHSPEEYYTDMYLEVDEESEIPFKSIPKSFYNQIGGYEDCRCEVYAADQILLGNGFIGLVVYELETVERIPYEQGSYVLFIVDKEGQGIDNIRIGTTFFTSDADVRNYSENVNSEIYQSDSDDSQVVLKRVKEASESISYEFGQEITSISSNFFKVTPNGKLENVTKWLEE